MEGLVNQLEVFQKIVKYLDISGNLGIIKAQCQKYRKHGVTRLLPLISNSLISHFHVL